MFQLVIWPILIGLAPLSVPIACWLIALSVRILISARDAIARRPVEGGCPDLRACCLRPPSAGGPEWALGFLGPLRVDGAEGMRLRPALLRLPSR